jgi:hypothetical protein
VQTRHEKRRVFKVFTIVEKPGADKGIWLEVGVANENRDGSLSAKLDALPVTGTLHIREFESKKQDGYRKRNDSPNTAPWRS